jgi:hypothetical protein
MVMFTIAEVKQFMAKLLTQNTFDDFIFREMELSTFMNYSINGRLNEGFFTGEELKERGSIQYALWNEVRNIAYAMIKGNKTPLSMKIVFQLSQDRTDILIGQSGGRIRPDEVGGLYMNVRFEKNELHIITGTAIKTFTLDKTLEQEWDKEVARILKEQGIVSTLA